MRVSKPHLLKLELVSYSPGQLCLWSNLISKTGGTASQMSSLAFSIQISPIFPCYKRSLVNRKCKQTAKKKIDAYQLFNTLEAKLNNTE